MMETSEIKLGDVKGQVENSKPVPSGQVAGRNGDARFFVPAGKPWKVDVTIAGQTATVASGMTSARAGKKFCLQVRTRVTDNSDEPIVPVEEPK